MKSTTSKNRILKAVLCTALVICLAASFCTGVFAMESSSSSTSSSSSSSSSSAPASSSSTPTSSSSEPAATNPGGTAFIAAYNVVDETGAEIVNLYPGTRCTVAFIVVDSRFDPAAAPWASKGNRADLTANIHAKINTSNFSAVTGTDAMVQKRESVNGALTYAVVFHDTVYQGTDNSFAFDLSFTENINGYDTSMGVPTTTLSQSIAQCAQTSESTIKTSVPSVMVRSSSYGSATVDAGSRFTLVITSYNTSATKNITDVRTTISLPQQLTLAGGSNMVLTNAVAAGQAFANTFELQALSSAETGVVNLTVDYTFYEQGTDQMLSSSQLITVSIVQPDRFSVTSVETPTDLYTGQEDIVTVNFVNKGKSILYNLSTEISGDMDTMIAEDAYVGNVNSGTESSADFTVMATTAGTHRGIITITYEDVNGNVKTQTADFEVVVSDMPVYDDMGGGGMTDDGMYPDMPADTGFTMPWWGWVLIAVGAAALIIVIRKIIKKRRAAKIEMELAEDDDEDLDGLEDDDDEDF